jgi:hypothetical protein
MLAVTLVFLSTVISVNSQGFFNSLKNEIKKEEAQNKLAAGSNRWVKVNFGNEIPADAVIGGKDADGSDLFVAHANYIGNWHPGKARKSWNNAHIEYGGQELSIDNFEVLVGNNGLGWTSVSGGNMPENAFYGGHENERNLYICRCEYEGTTQLGKTWQGNTSCNIGYGGRGINVPSYEVLVHSANAPNLAVSPSVGGQQNIYIVGYTNNNSSNGIAKIWKNGVATNLTSGASDGFAYGVFVNGPDVYVAGTDGFVAKYWKNGAGVSLSDGSGTAYAHSIYANGGDVYVAGVVGTVVTLWKNGVANSLSDGKDPFAVGNSLFVEGNDVYVAGSDNHTAKLWKNGVARNLSDGRNSANAYSVVVHRGVSYVVGSDNGVAKVWRDGVGQSLTNGSNNAAAYSIAVNDKGVYIVGNDGPTAKMWFNGVVTNLTDGSKQGFAKSVWLNGDDVYVAGNNGNVSEPGNVNQYWKNGVPTTFDNSCYISSIVVK